MTLPRARRRSTLVLGAVLVAAPWLWFAVRDHDGEIADTIAVGLPLVAVVLPLLLVALAVWRRRLLPLFVAMSVFAACIVAIVAPRLTQPSPAPTTPIRIATANVFDENPTPDATIAALVARQVDVLATVEMGPDFWTAMDGVTGLPYAIEYGEIGVHARWPIELLGPEGMPRTRILRIGVDAPGTPFVLYVAHALNPLHDYSTFADQQALARMIVANASRERRPVVIVGDFNTSDRAVAYRIFDGSLRDAMRAGGFAPSTYFGGLWPLLLLRIDHVFVSPSWCAADPSSFDMPGSDHHGIQVTVGPCP